MNTVMENTAKTEQELREAQKLLEKMESKMKVHNDEYQMLKSRQLAEIEEKQKLHQANIELGHVIKAKREEIKAQTAERDKMQKNYDALKRKKQMEDEEVVDLDRQREGLKADLKSMVRE